MTQKKRSLRSSTIRSLKTRLLEHKKDIGKGQFKTALVKALYNYNIDIRWNEAKIVRTVKKCT